MQKIPPPLIAAVGFLLSLPLVCGREGVSLPQWTDEELALPTGELFRAAAALWPAGDYTPQPGSAEDELAEEPPRVSDELALANMQDLPADLFVKFFPDQPPGQVIDPQHLVTRARLDGLLTFLEFHDKEARSRICLLVLGPNHRVPSALDLAELHQRWFDDSLTALVLYNFGNPGMSQVIFGKGTESRVEEATLRDSCLQSISEALDATNAEEQLERFLTELSRRLYWVEAAFHGAEQAPAKAKQSAKKQETADARFHAMRIAAIRGGVIGLAALLVIAGTLLFLQRQAANKSYYFPDRPISPRLGAPHGGGSRLLVSIRKDPEAKRHW